MIHYIQSIFLRAFETHPFAKLIKLHPTANGWVGVIKCLTSKNEYIISILPVKSEAEVVKEHLTPDQVIKDGGFYVSN